MNAERLRVYPRVFVVLYLLLTAIWMLLARDGLDLAGKPLGYDFIAFWSAAKLALAGQPTAAYDLNALFAMQQAAVPAVRTVNAWQYPPGFLLLVMPLALLPYLTAFTVFVTGSFALFAAAWCRVAPAGAGMLLLLAFPGTFQNAVHGQNGFLTAALVAGGLLALPSRPLLAGLLFGVLTIKPHLALLLPVALVAGRHYRALLAAGAAALLLLAVSLAVLGTAVWPAFIGRLPVVAQWLANAELPLAKMPTFFAFARLLDLPLSFAWGLQSAVAMAVMIATGWLWRRPDAAPALKAAALTTGCLLISPYLYDYDLVWLALPLAWYGGHARVHGWQRGEREWLLGIGLLPAFVAVAVKIVNVQLAPFALLGFFVVILRRAAAESSSRIAE